MIMPSVAFHTADMVRRLPDDGRRYETVHGELLVTPAPRVWHEVVRDRLAQSLRSYLALVKPDAYLMSGPADISWGEDTLVRPDIFVAPLVEVRTLRWDAIRRLLLVVEVLSPSTARADRFAKRRLYQEVGIPVYWVIDPDGHGAEMWTPDAVFPRSAVDRLEWLPEGAPVPFQIDLGELFRPL